MPLLLPDSIPYPAGPDPESLSLKLTRLPRTVRTVETLRLLGQVLFIVAALAFLAGCVAGLIVSAQQLTANPPIALIGLVTCSLVLFVLARSFARAHGNRRSEDGIAITVEEQPVLMAFLRRVCDDVGVEFPRTVTLTPEVNASIQPVASLASMVRSPQYDLSIGLGLVNVLNLSEFQAVMAHEFAHDSHRGPIALWGRTVGAVVSQLLGRRAPLSWHRRAILGAQSDYCRECEFHADRVAASIAGSNVTASALLKAHAGSQSFRRAIEALQRLAPRRLFTSDLYYHQHAAGIADVPDDSPPPGTHPELVERCERLAACDTPAPPDDRPTWLLIRNAPALRQQMTARVIRSWPGVPDHPTLADPRMVQARIDEDHGTFRFDDCYGGIYDQRDIRIAEEIDDLLHDCREADIEELAAMRVELSVRIARRGVLLEQRNRLIDARPGADLHHQLKCLADLNERLDRFDAGFDAHDRLVARHHLALAARLDPRRDAELARLYGALPAIQQSHAEMQLHRNRVRIVTQCPIPDNRDRLRETVGMLRAAHATLAEVNDRDSLLGEATLMDLPAGPLQLTWMTTLQRQLDLATNRLARRRAEQIARILHLQEAIAAAAISTVQAGA